MIFSIFRFFCTRFSNIVLSYITGNIPLMHASDDPRDWFSAPGSHVFRRCVSSEEETHIKALSSELLVCCSSGVLLLIHRYSEPQSSHSTNIDRLCEIWARRCDVVDLKQLCCLVTINQLVIKILDYHCLTLEHKTSHEIYASSESWINQVMIGQY